MSKVGSLLREMRRRGVLQTAAMYIVGAWVLMQAADVLFPGADIPESSIRYVFLGALLGFPLVMIFGWLYDVGAHGISRTPPKDSPEGSLPLRRRDHVVLGTLASVGAVLLLGVSGLILDDARLPGTVDAPVTYASNSIAVLPFVNMSGDPAQEYFGDGIAEELLNRLANLRSLRVAARTSSFFFKDKNQSVREIGRQLRVGTVLEGSVRKSGQRIRVTAQLINTEDGFHLWSETFDRDSGDILEIQDEIARSIADTLEVEMLAKDTRRLASAPTDNVDAYDLYLLARYHREQRNREALEKSITLFKQALAADERFAPAYAGLAASYVYQAYYSEVTPERVMELADPLLAKALEIDPELPEAYVARGSLRLLHRDLDAADKDFLKAIELRPSQSGAWHSLGYSRVLQSRMLEAADAYARAQELDPMNASTMTNAGALMMLTGRYEEGAQTLRRVYELAPERQGIERMLIHWSTVYGDYAEAVAWARRLLQREPDAPAAADSMAQVYGNLGLWGPAFDLALAAYEKAPNNSLYVNRIANFYLHTDDHAGLAEFVAREYAKIDKLAPTQYSPTDRERYLWHGVAALREGSYDQAVKDLTDAAGGQAGIDNAVYDAITPIKYLAYALQRQGQHERASQILDRCLSLATEASRQGWATPSIHYRTAQIYSLLGRPDEAVAQLQQAIDKGWRIFGALERDPLWGPMQDDVRFQAIVARVNDDIRVLREEVGEVLGEI
jgi:TolB-like protein/Tfp pilus assembly protein PilF